LRVQYKSKSNSVYSEFIRRSENEIKINPKKFWNWVSYNNSSRDILNSVSLNDKTANTDRDIAEQFSFYFSSVYKPPVIPLVDISTLTSSIKKFDHILPSHCSISFDEVSDGL
jgi:hypothetical protein